MPYKDKKEAAACAKRAYHRRRDKVNKIKTDSGCVDCGFNVHPFALDFDHVRGVKKYCISEMTQRSMAWHLIVEETNKCDVVCANCHRLRHLVDRAEDSP